MGATTLLRKPDGYGLAVLLDCIRLCEAHAQPEPTGREGRFVTLEALEAGDHIRWEGEIRTVAKVNKCQGAPKMRVTFLGGGVIIVPFGARFTRIREVG